VMIGEIRDLETAADRGAGLAHRHLCLRRLHTNDAASAVTRLADMVSSRISSRRACSACSAQRLVRTLCPACTSPVAATRANATAGADGPAGARSPVRAEGSRRAATRLPGARGSTSSWSRTRPCGGTSTTARRRRNPARRGTRGGMAGLRADGRTLARRRHDWLAGSSCASPATLSGADRRLGLRSGRCAGTRPRGRGASTPTARAARVTGCAHRV